MVAFTQQGAGVGETEKGRRFSTLVIPHIAAAYNLARWLVRDPSDAEDIVQESCLRAFRFLDELRNGDGRAWLLAIVRNTSYTWLQQNRMRDLSRPLDQDPPDESQDPEAAAQRAIDQGLLRKCMERLPLEFREVIVLRDLEGLSYREIANAVNIPIGTVMSRLARGRTQLQRWLIQRPDPGPD